MAVKTIELSPTPKFIPSHVSGDRDFAGHGPQVAVWSRLRVANGNQLWVRVGMRARETTSDFTTAEGSADFLVYNGAEDGVDTITRLLSGRFSFDSYTDDDHQDDFRDQPGGELVRTFVVTGDTRGNEAGTRTGIVVHFNPVEFEFEPREGPIQTVTVDPMPKFVPPHVAGDRDFGGHGPDVEVSASISIQNDNEIWARVQMRAIETRPDFTEARGSTTHMIYRHGRPILQILSGTQSTGRYTDEDHDTDPITTAAGELVRQFLVTGDTRGNEAGTRTGVVVDFNPITFLRG